MSTNLYRQLRALLPLPQVLVGTVVEIHADDTSTVQLPGTVDVTGYPGNVATGSLIRVRGSSVAVGSRAFVRAGVIESQASDGDILDVEVGTVVVTPEPGETEWWMFGSEIGGTTPPADGSQIAPPGTGAMTITGTTFFLQRRRVERTSGGTVIVNEVSTVATAPSVTWTPTPDSVAPDDDEPTIALEDAARGLWKIDVPLVSSEDWTGGLLLIAGQYELAITFVPPAGAVPAAASWAYRIP
jgi:hypothetical protein